MKPQNFKEEYESWGQALVTVIIVLAVVFALGAGLLFHSRSFRDFAGLQGDNDRAYSLSRSGLDIADSFLNLSPCGCNEDNTYYFGSDTLRVQVSTAFQSVSGQYVVTGNITSTGTSDKSQRIFRDTYNSGPIQGFAKTDGSSTNNEEISFVRQTQDGGYVLGGDVVSGGSYNFIVIKTKADGTKEWTKTYDTGFRDELFCLQQTSDGGYILGGDTSYGGGDTNFLVIKTDDVGVMIWAKVYDGGVTTTDNLKFIQQTQDGGYVFGGPTLSGAAAGGDAWDFLIIRTDPSGGPIWTKIYDVGISNNSSEMFYCLQEFSGGYILGGSTNALGGGEFLLIKTDSSGNAGLGYPGTWAKTYGGGGSDEIYYLQQTQDSGYILGGKTASFGLASQFLAIKTDSLGAVGWARTYGGALAEQINSLQQTQDSGYILGGPTTSFGSGSQFFVVKVDSNGEVGVAFPGTWAKTYGGINSDELYSLQQTIDGGYMLGGWTSSFAGSYDSLLIKTDPQGDLMCCNIYQDITSQVTGTAQSITANDQTSNIITGVPSIVSQDVSLTVNNFTITERLVCPITPP